MANSKQKVYVIEEAIKGENDWEPLDCANTKKEAVAAKRGYAEQAANMFPERNLVYRVVKYTPEKD
tara:strand:- start:19132 stop:19329 length:198 start_codon:yes stop_codon:yes gene_type:complete